MHRRTTPPKTTASYRNVPLPDVVLDALSAHVAATPAALTPAGQSVKVVQARRGHATTDETLDTDAHLWPDSEERSRAAVGAGLGRSVAASEPGEGQARRSGN